MGQHEREAGGAARSTSVEIPLTQAGCLAAADFAPRLAESAPRAPDRVRHPRPGDRLGRFEIIRELGRGGFGIVYEARDTVLWRRVALKLFSLDVTSHESLAEAEALAALNHPAIVTLHEMGVSPVGHHLVFELLEGETLAERLRRAPLALREALAIANQVARALEHAHGRGVVHRDLKPSNVFLCQDGGVKVLDFGVATLFGGGPLLGATPGFCAPEQLRGLGADERSDVYAAAATLLSCLGEPPPGEPGAGAPVLDGLPRPLARLLSEALSEDPALRPVAGVAWRARLDRAQARIASGRRRALAGVAAALALLALAGALAVGARLERRAGQADGRARVVAHERARMAEVARADPLTDPAPAGAAPAPGRAAPGARR